jgi:hypothetical protein
VAFPFIDAPHNGVWQGGELDVRGAVPVGHPPGGHIIDAVHDGPGGADIAGAGDDSEDELRVAVAPAGVVDEQPPQCRMGHSRYLQYRLGPGSGCREHPSGPLTFFAALWREAFVIGVTVPPASWESAVAITLSRSAAAC